MKTVRGFLIGLVAAVAGAAGLALAASNGGVQTMVGAFVDSSDGRPTLSITGGSSAQLGGANSGVYVNTATTAAGTLTFPDAAPNGRVCDFNDESNVASVIVHQTAATDGKTVVTVAGTVTAGDKIAYQCTGF